MTSERSGSRFEEGSRDGDGLFTAHDDKLFDDNSSQSGETYDLGTGMPINNSVDEFDNLGALSPDEAAEIGFRIVADDSGIEDDDDTIEYVDHWLEVQEGLAKAAERGITLSQEEDIA